MKFQLASLQCIHRGRPRPRIECNSQQERALTRDRERGLRWCGKRASAHSFLPPPSLPFRWRPRSLARSLCLWQPPPPPLSSSSHVFQPTWWSWTISPSTRNGGGGQTPTDRQRGSVCPTEDGRAGVLQRPRCREPRLPFRPPAEGRGRSVSRERKRLPPFRGRPFIIILAATSVERGPKRLRQGFSASERWINT